MTEQTNIQPDHPGVRRLLAFFEAMNAWESMMLQQSRDMEKMFQGVLADQVQAGLDRLNSEARAKLVSIFETFCEVGAGAKRLKYALHFGGLEPNYNAEKERILSVTEKGGRLVVETRMTHQLCERLRYELVYLRGEWMIRDTRKFYAEAYSKWHRHDL